MQKVIITTLLFLLSTSGTLPGQSLISPTVYGTEIENVEPDRRPKYMMSDPDFQSSVLTLIATDPTLQAMSVTPNMQSFSANALLNAKGLYHVDSLVRQITTSLRKQFPALSFSRDEVISYITMFKGIAYPTILPNFNNLQRINDWFRKATVYIKQNSTTAIGLLNKLNPYISKSDYTMLMQKLDNYKNRYNSELEEYRERLTEQFFKLIGKNHPFVPATTTKLSELYWGNTDMKTIGSLDNAYLSLRNNGGVLYSELLNLNAGPIHISSGGLVSKTQQRDLDSAQLADIIATTDSSNQVLLAARIDSLLEATDSVNLAKYSVNQLLSGGGNAMVTFSTPLLDWHTRDEVFKARVFAYDRACLSIPAYNKLNDDFFLINELALEANALLNLPLNNFKEKEYLSVSGSFKGSWIRTIGNKNNAEFYEMMGLDEEYPLFFTVSGSLIFRGIRFNVQYHFANDQQNNENIKQLSFGTSIVLD